MKDYLEFLDEVVNDSRNVLKKVIERADEDGCYRSTALEIFYHRVDEEASRIMDEIDEKKGEKNGI